MTGDIWVTSHAHVNGLSDLVVHCLEQKSRGNDARLNTAMVSSKTNPPPQLGEEAAERIDRHLRIDLDAP